MGRGIGRIGQRGQSGAPLRAGRTCIPVYRQGCRKSRECIFASVDLTPAFTHPSQSPYVSSGAADRLR